MSASEWRPFGATGERGTCEWCGCKLRPFKVYAQFLPGKADPDIEAELRTRARLSRGTDAGFRILTTHHHPRETSVTYTDGRMGDYGDDLCSLRCGYQFGREMKRHGHKLRRARGGTDR